MISNSQNCKTLFKTYLYDKKNAGASCIEQETINLLLYNNSLYYVQLKKCYPVFLYLIYTA